MFRMPQGLPSTARIYSGIRSITVTDLIIKTFRASLPEPPDPEGSITPNLGYVMILSEPLTR